MLKFSKKRLMMTKNDIAFGDKKMKTCMECGRKLGIIGGYRHPTLGKEYLLCGTCFDAVFESVERYRELISPYVGFFHKESSTRDDLNKLTTKMIHGVTKIQSSMQPMAGGVRSIRFPIGENQKNISEKTV
jgi:hypothetical protein